MFAAGGLAGGRFVDATAVNSGGGRAVTFGRFRAALCAHEGLARDGGEAAGARGAGEEGDRAERAREYRDS